MTELLRVVNDGRPRFVCGAEVREQQIVRCAPLLGAILRRQRAYTRDGILRLAARFRWKVEVIS